MSFCLFFSSIVSVPVGVVRLESCFHSQIVKKFDNSVSSSYFLYFHLFLLSLILFFYFNVSLEYLSFCLWFALSSLPCPLCLYFHSLRLCGRRREWKRPNNYRESEGYHENCLMDKAFRNCSRSTSKTKKGVLSYSDIITPSRIFALFLFTF